MKKILLIVSLFCATTAMAQVPTDAPTAPTANQDDVISIYSETYTDVATKPWNPSWGNIATLTFETIAGNEVAVYNNLDFTGIEPTATFDITNYSHFNISYWTTASVFKVKLVDFGPDGIWSGGPDDTEHELSFTPTTDEWNYLSIPISDFTGMTTTEHFAQLILVSSGSGATVYVDDMYFYNEQPTAVSDIKESSLNIYPNPASEKITIEYPRMTQLTISNATGQTIISQKFQTTNSKTIDLYHLKTGVFFITIETTDEIKSSIFLKK